MQQIRSARSAMVLFALGLLLSQGCGSPTEPAAPGSIFVTSQAVYEIAPGSLTVTVTFLATNTLNRPILLDGHDRVLMSLEKKTGGSWTVVYSPVYLAYAVPPITLMPGESRTYQLNLNAATTPGLYRAVFLAGYKGNEGGQEYSNEFEVSLAQ